MSSNLNILKQNPGGGRNSTVETLRILAMFMVLMLHANYMSIGWASPEILHANPLQGFCRIAFYQFAYIAVNVFVLISGWFSIKFTLKGLLRFLFQCYFFCGVLFIAQYFVQGTFDFASVRNIIFLNTTWFITPYIVLFITAPILNAFVEHSSQKQLRNFLIVFYVIQSIMGIFNPTFAYGYSYISFIGLYLLARYVRVYKMGLCKFGIELWLAPLAFNILFILACTWFNKMGFTTFLKGYSSPLVVCSALGLLLTFARMKPKHSRIINWMGLSCFGVFLIHCGLDWSIKFYTTTAKEIFDSYSGFAYLGMIFLFMCAVFAAGILLDQPRIWLWKGIEKLFFRPKARID